MKTREQLAEEYASKYTASPHYYGRQLLEQAFEVGFDKGSTALPQALQVIRELREALKGISSSITTVHEVHSQSAARSALKRADEIVKGRV